MEALGPIRILGAVCFALFAAGIASRFVKATPKLAPRVRPYTAVSRSNLGRTPDIFALYMPSSVLAGGVLRRLYAPMVETLVRWLIRITGRQSQEQLLLKLRQLEQMREVPEEQRVHEFRVRQVQAALKYMLVLMGLAIVTEKSLSVVLLGALFGALYGGSRPIIRLNADVQTRRDRMRIEIYTVNQQLAMHMRTGGSSVQAVQRLISRGNGEVINELREALRLHMRGMPASKAFLRAAELTPEPHVARTYKLLGTGSERGADLANALLALSDDVRDARRESLRRAATKRRGQMLIPIVSLLAPLMILFVIAPIPSLFYGATH